jgi:hypothetical protein
MSKKETYLLAHYSFSEPLLSVFHEQSLKAAM